MPRRNLAHVKLNAGLRHALVYHRINLQDNIVVTEYPKSGGSWVCQMLSEALDIPFPRNRLPVSGKQILHGHYAASKRIKNPLVVLRDGRDVAVSYYFHSLFENEKFNGRLVERTSKRLNFSDTSDVEHNMPAFLEFIFSEKMFPRYSWVEFTEGWLDLGSTWVKYEQFLNNPAETLTYACRSAAGIELEKSRADTTIEKYSFQNMSNRQSGVEDKKSFLRKGIAGDWKTKFSKEAKDIFEHFAGKTLIRCGYEDDNSWINND